MLDPSSKTCNFRGFQLLKENIFSPFWGAYYMNNYYLCVNSPGDETRTGEPRIQIVAAPTPTTRQAAAEPQCDKHYPKHSVPSPREMR